jgi:hypothetical protein
MVAPDTVTQSKAMTAKDPRSSAESAAENKKASSTLRLKRLGNS